MKEKRGYVDISFVVKLSVHQGGGMNNMSSLENGAGVGGDTRPQVSTLLGHGARDSRALHLSLVVHNDTSVILEVDEDTLLAAPGPALTHDDSRVDLLPELGLAFLAGSHDQITDGGGGQLVQSTLNTVYGNNHQGLGASVVSAVHHCCDGQTQSSTKLGADSSSSSCRINYKENKQNQSFHSYKSNRIEP